MRFFLALLANRPRGRLGGGGDNASGHSDHYGDFDRRGHGAPLSYGADFLRAAFDDLYVDYVFEVESPLNRCRLRLTEK